MDLKLSEVKAAAKAKGATINDFITTCLSTTCNEYFAKRLKKDEPAPTQFKAVIPFSLRPTPT